MKTPNASVSLFVSFTLAGVSITGHARADGKIPSHAVTTEDGVPVENVETASLPSPAHVEGTVFAAIGNSYDPQAHLYVAEIDVARSVAIHRAEIGCEALRHDGDALYASCARQLVAFDAATLAVRWRGSSSPCPGERAGAAIVASNHAGRVAVAFACGGLLLVRVVRASDGALLGATNTVLDVGNGWRHDVVRVTFHGARAFAARYPPSGDPAIVALSADYGRVERRLKLSGPGQWVWDDGTHIHAHDDPDSFAAQQARRVVEEKMPWRPPPRVPAWLAPRRDYTLSDALVPISDAPLTPPEDGPRYMPATASGDFIDYELDQGPQHFWLARGCCGSGVHGGLYVGKRP